MKFDAPKSFSPSSLSQFTTCPLAFRFNYIEHRYSPPMVSATKGSIVHRALELLFLKEAKDRTQDNAHKDLETALDEYKRLPDLIELDLSETEQKNLESESHKLIDNYFQIESPQSINPIGIELKLEAQVGDTLIRGIIDRLEIEDGELIVTDYKTGSVPRAQSESSKLGGVHLYSLLCEKIFGKLPKRVQLIYLSASTSIIATPTSSSVKGVQLRSNAIRTAVLKACESGDFRPNPSVLCNWCGYQDLCPAKGGVLDDD